MKTKPPAGLLLYSDPNHRAAPEFWSAYHALPPDIRLRADKQFSLLRADPQHPSLRFKKLRERRGEEIMVGPHHADDALIF